LKGGFFMADYKKMYLKLLDSTEKAINELIVAQSMCEEIYVLSADEDNNDGETQANDNTRS
jgi:hypothetical protein